MGLKAEIARSKDPLAGMDSPALRNAFVARPLSRQTQLDELSDEEAWNRLVSASKEKDLDAFRLSLRAYARALNEGFNLAEIEGCLRQDKLPIYLIAKQQEIAKNMTIVDLIGNPDQMFVLTIQLSEKPRRARMAQGWPETPDENLRRLTKAGFIQDKGVPLCSNCGGVLSSIVYSRFNGVD